MPEPLVRWQTTDLQAASTSPEAIGHPLAIKAG